MDEHGGRSDASRWPVRLLAVAVGLLVVGPALGPGFVLVNDMVFVPRQDLTAEAVGLGTALPRAVPSDGVMGVLTAVVPGDLLQKAALTLLVVAAVLGAARLVGRVTGGLAGPAVAGLVYGWSPYLAERLLMGHWSLLIGYAALPWVAMAALDLRADRPGAATRLVLAMAPAALAATGGVLATGVAVALGGRRKLAWTIGTGAVLGLPWVVAGLLHPGGGESDPAGVVAFAARAENWGGPLLAVLGGGGIWNGAAVPASRASVVAPLLTVLLGALAGFGWRAANRLIWLGLLGVALACVGTVPGLREGLGWLVSVVPGGGLLRDGQKWAAWWMLALAVGVGAGVVRLAGVVESRRDGPHGARAELRAPWRPSRGLDPVDVTEGERRRAAPVVAVGGLWRGLLRRDGRGGARLGLRAAPRRSRGPRRASGPDAALSSGPDLDPGRDPGPGLGRADAPEGGGRRAAPVAVSALRRLGLRRDGPHRASQGVRARWRQSRGAGPTPGSHPTPGPHPGPNLDPDAGSGPDYALGPGVAPGVDPSPGPCFGPGSRIGPHPGPGDNPATGAALRQFPQPPAAGASADRLLAARSLIVVALLVPIVAVPDLAWGVGGRLVPVAYPEDWDRVRTVLAEDPRPGAVLALPFGAIRSFGWNAGRPQLDPAPRYLPRSVVVDDTLVIGGAGGERIAVAGEDGRARVVAGRLDDPGGLAAAGIGWVLVERGTPGAGPGPAVGALPRVVDGEWLTLLRIPGPVAESPAAPPAAWVLVVGAHLVALAMVLAAVLARIQPLSRRPAGVTVLRRRVGGRRESG